MTNAALAKLVAEENDQREQNLLNEARDHVERILALQAAIESANKEINEHRKALKHLELKPASLQAILGE